MKVLVIGGGGREHALAWHLHKRASGPREILACPGNPGIEEVGRCLEIDDGVVALADWAQANSVDLTVVGPENYLASGLVDEFTRRGLAAFGPTKAAARLESSKVFAKEFMVRHNIPTARAEVFDDYQAARAYVRGADLPCVIKADGLAAGKGVRVARTREEAYEWLELLMVEGLFGQAGKTVLIEEMLVGHEATVMAFCDGQTFVPMVPAQDHKPVYDGDRGPNTGGMGVYSPVPLVDEELQQFIGERILRPAVEGMAAEGCPYKGVLYAGLMIDEGEARVVEFNCRFGDPEAQVVLPRMESDLLPIMQACIEGRLAKVDPPRFSDQAAVCVILASGGYPDDYETGYPISGLDYVEKMPVVTVFHAGTEVKDGRLYTAGGRVVGVTALGVSLEKAIERVYKAVGHIHFQNMHYRTDIGRKALEYQRQRMQSDLGL